MWMLHWRVIDTQKLDNSSTYVQANYFINPCIPNLVPPVLYSLSIFIAVPCVATHVRCEPQQTSTTTHHCPPILMTGHTPT